VFNLPITQLLREFLHHQETLPGVAVNDPQYAERWAEYLECVDLLIAHRAFNGLYFEPLETLIKTNPKLQDLAREYDLAQKNSS
jgi:hypothetical protein